MSQNLKLTIIGKGDDRKRLINIAEHLDVKQYVNFMGFVENDSRYDYISRFSTYSLIAMSSVLMSMKSSLRKTVL